MTKRRVESGRGKTTVKANARKAPKPAASGPAPAPIATAAKAPDAAPLAIAAPAPTVVENTALPIVEAAPAKLEPKTAAVKAKVGNARKLPAPEREAKAAAPTPPVPAASEGEVPAIVENIALPIVEAAPAKPELKKAAVKAKVRNAPKPPAPGRGAKAATPTPPIPAESEKDVPTPMVELASMTDEPNAEAAADTSPAPAPIDAVPPIPAPAEAEVAAEATAFEEPPETVPPVETPAFVDEADASASEQPAAMDDRTATPALENILVSVTKENPFFKEPTTFVRENLDAMVHSSNAASAGLEALGQEIADFGWRRFDEAFDAWKGLLQSRSPVERFQRQCDYARSALDDILGESSKVTLAVIKLAGEVSQPVTRRFAGAIDRSSR